jgi:hypothetical protein
MPQLGVHLKSGDHIIAPVEAWIVAILNSLPDVIAADIFKRVSTMQGASLIPDKFKVGEDALGGITIVEKPVVDMNMLKG